MKNILVPTDFSECASYALQTAAQIARKHRANIKLLHVFTPAGSVYTNVLGMGVSMDNEYLKNVEEQLNKQVKLLKQWVGNESVEISSEIKIGNPFSSISSDISDNQADMVIMGSEGSSGLDEVLIGSVAERVIRNATCPVLTVKNVMTIDDIKNIVYAVNFENEQSKVMLNLKTFLKTFKHARLHLVQVNTPSNWVTTRYARQKMDAFIEAFDIGNYTLNFYNDSTVEEGIHHFANDMEADIIALATHARSGISHLFKGSITEKIVNHTRSAVWSCQL